MYGAFPHTHTHAPQRASLEIESRVHERERVEVCSKLIKLVIFVAFFACGLLVASKAQAATYYVNGSGTQYVGAQGTYGVGNDSTGNGSLATPWASLQKASNTLSAGGTVYIAEATYQEGLGGAGYLNISYPISYIADGNVKVQATGSATRAAYLAASASGATFTGITFDANNASSAFELATTLQNVTLTNCSLIGFTGYGIKGNDNHGTVTLTNPVITSAVSGANYAIYRVGNGIVTISGANISGTYADVLYSITLGTMNWSGNTVTASVSSVVIEINTSGVLSLSHDQYTISGTPISWIYIHPTATGSISVDHEIVSGTASYTGNVFNSNPTSVFTITAFTNNSITPASVAVTKYLVFMQNCGNPTITGNLFDGSNVSNSIRGLFVTSTLANPVVPDIEYNIVKTKVSEGYGIGVGQETTTIADNSENGAIIKHNQIYGSHYFNPATAAAQHGIFFGFSLNAVIEDNLVNGAGYGIVIKHGGSAWTGGRIAYNIFINNLDYAGMHSKGAQAVLYYNNIVYNDPTLTQSAYGLYLTVNVAGQTSINTVAKNNIIWLKAGQQSIYTDASSTAGHTLDDNLFRSNTGVVNFTVGASNYANFTAWQIAGYDLHSLNTDPQFTSIGSDFSLLPTSLAIDAGTTTSTMTSTTTDYLGHPIYGTPDIGAYEYQPPFKIGTDKVDPTGNIRIYGDGQYRYTTATSSTMSANLQAAPVGGFSIYAASTTRPEWLNISNITWGATKQWTASSSSTTVAPYGVQATTTIFTVGDLTPNKIYIVTVDSATSTAIASTSCSQGICTAGSDGKLILTYTGGYSTHTFAVTPDTTAPSITLTSPASPTTASSTITLTATTTDNVGIGGVTFYRGTTAIGSEITATSAPNTYTTSWNTALIDDGSYSITAVARDTSNNYATSSPAIAVTVDNTAPVRSSGSPSTTLSVNTTSTTISLTTALESATCKYSTTAGTAYNSMTAFTTTGGTTHSKLISGLTNGGSYVYYVKCQDAVGNTNLTDYTISFTVAADTTSPTVSVTAPSNNATVSGKTVTISADATDDVSVSGVQFKLDIDTLIGSEDTSSPYSTTWDSTAVADGTHTIIAVARDGTGNYATSSTITITVLNTVPTPTVTTSGSSGGGGTLSAAQLAAILAPSASTTTYINSLATSTVPGCPAGLICTPNPVVAAVPAYTFTLDLSQGSSGDEVMRLQKMLASLGYLTAAPTGYFGPLTKAAVMKYQGDHGLQGVGLVGPLTRALLNGSGGASMFATSSPAVSPSNAPSVTFSSTLTLGSTGSDVKALQVFLNAQGFKVASSGAGSPGNETTYFGNATKSALMKFQLAHKAEILDSQRLTAPTGFFGTATMKVVNGMMKSQ